MRKKKVSNYFNYIIEILKHENQKLREKLALMKTQLNAKDSVINAKDEEIKLLKKRLKEYEDISF